jgi:hypothetical protein
MLGFVDMGPGDHFHDVKANIPRDTRRQRCFFDRGRKSTDYSTVVANALFRVLWGREEEKPRGGENMG